MRHVEQLQTMVSSHLDVSCQRTTFNQNITVNATAVIFVQQNSSNMPLNGAMKPLLSTDIIKYLPI